MHRKSMLTDRPVTLLITLGGAVGTILASSLMYLAPATGLPLLDVPSTLGHLFTADDRTAFWVGYGIFFVGGWLVLPLALAGAWPELPGGDGLAGAAVKGIVFGVATWLLCGLLVGAADALAGAEGPGWFALGAGLTGALELLAGAIAYGLAVSLVGAMGQGLSPLDSLGWVGHGAGSQA